MSGVPIMQCGAEDTKCQINMTAFNGLPDSDFT
jgi:hypothetical protein